MRLFPFLLLLACGDATIKLDGDDPIGDDTGQPDSGDSGHTDEPSDTGEPGPIELPPDVLVDCEGAGDYTTIQAGIDAALSGDRIGVMPCEYHERLDFLGKYLDVYGTEGSAVTLLDADQTGTAVNIETGEALGTRFAGFTIVDGYDPSGGSAIEVEGAALALEDLVVSDNGDGAYVIQASVAFVDMIDVVVQDNIVYDSAIRSDGGSITLERVTVDCGTGSNALWQHDASLVIDSTLTCDAGYGLQSYHGEINVVRSRVEGGIAGIWVYDEIDSSTDERAFISNSAVGGGQYGANLEYEQVQVVNSVLWGTDAALRLEGNDAASYAYGNVLVGAACGIDGDTLAYTLRYNAFWDNVADTCDATASDSVTDDPDFASFPDDLTLGGNSPLVDAGPTGTEWDDTDGTRNDIGIYGGPRPATF